MSKDLPILIYEAMQMTGTPGKPKSIPLFPLNLVPKGFHLYMLPLRLQYLYMLVDEIIVKAGGSPYCLSSHQENLVGQIFGYVDSVLRECSEEFQECHAILVCENWFVLPISKEEDEYLTFLYNYHFLTLQLWPLSTDKTLLN